MGKTVCSWCDKVIIKENGFDGDSFGICEKCHEEVKADLDKMRKQQEEAAKNK